MFDFFSIETKFNKSANKTDVYPNFIAKKSKDLMIRGHAFYAFWNENTKMWSKDIYDMIEIIDKELDNYYEKHKEALGQVNIKYMRKANSGSMRSWNEYSTKFMEDNYHPLDNKIIFANTEIDKKDYCTRKLPYDMVDIPIPAWSELMGTLYDKDNLDILEWCIGSIISGDSKKIEKCCILYGESGKGKSTFLKIVQKMFEGYWSPFDAKGLGSMSNQFALEDFKNNPLISIEHDGVLSGIEDNTLLNKIISHEEVMVNEKHKTKYASRFDTFLFMGTNEPVKITDSKSGIIRRLLDVSPSGNKVPRARYDELMGQINFELGGIAYHCFEKYKKMGKSYYDTYVPIRMISETNEFYNFLNELYDELVKEDSTTLAYIWSKYKEYCLLADIRKPLKMNEVRIELKSYFEEYHERYRCVNEPDKRNYYKGFRSEKFQYKTTRQKKGLPEKDISWIVLDKKKSILDTIYADCPAQLATEDEKPKTKWSQVLTTLKDIDTSKTHYVKIPKNHIVIDFDLKDENGNKSFKKNIEAAAKWPPTYAETSKSGEGIHLHYIYNGDVSKLSSIYSDDIEVKTFSGNSSLRRKVIFCNAMQLAVLSSGLPLKEEKKVVDETTIKNEKHLRKLIIKNLNKEIHASTKPSVDFIFKLLEDAYNSKDFTYDVSDMRQAITYFASNSTNQAEACLKLVSKMHFKSEEEPPDRKFGKEAPIVFYDVEVFPNLFLINWKFRGKSEKCKRMINPEPNEVKKLFQYRLIGYNNRRYDNHVIYARAMGYSNEELYRLSQKLVSSAKGVNNSAMFANAYNLSYTDVYDFCKTKQSLKKWEIDLGIHHQELGLPWDQPVPEDKWEQVAEYCDNDVYATEAVFEACQSDFVAREIIAELSGLSVNHTTNAHSAKIIFGDDKNPQSQFVYTDLSEMFPGYTFDAGKSTYRGVEVGEGGYVYAEPGMYENVWTFDVASMHPHSIIELNLFGDVYTKRFKDLVQMRLCIKHGDFEKAGELFDGKLKKYLTNKDMAAGLSEALKIVINSVYGQTAARYECAFKDPRNKDNIVAKRGALFMVDLKNKLEENGVQVIHIKTDSIKVQNPSEETKKLIYNFGHKYGYTFEIENVYSKFCLVNDAVYIAKYAEPKKGQVWSAVGAQFAKPYVFKHLFSNEPILFEDMCETKQVKTALYLDLNEGLPEGEHNYKFVGKNGLFCPVVDGVGGGLLVAEREDPKTHGKKYDHPAGTKGYKWLESEVVKENKLEDSIDKSYYIHLVDEAIETISKFGDIEQFIF